MRKERKVKRRVLEKDVEDGITMHKVTGRVCCDPRDSHLARLRLAQEVCSVFCGPDGACLAVSGGRGKRSEQCVTFP